MKNSVKKTALLAAFVLFTAASIFAQEPVKKEKKEVKTEQCCKKHGKSDCKKSHKKENCKSECKKSDKVKNKSNCSKKGECCKSKKEKK